MSAALDEASARMEQAARSAIDLMIRARAERYRRQPWLLDALHPGLSTASPAAMLACVDALIEIEDETPRRHVGFGGENTAISLRAARLYAERESQLEAA